MGKARKYKNVKLLLDGHNFDSMKEASYYGKLKILKRSGEVLSFEIQPRYDLVVNGVKLGFYKGDFLVNYANGETKLIDVKGVILPIYRLKKKLVKALYGIDIIEV